MSTNKDNYPIAIKQEKNSENIGKKSPLSKFKKQIATTGLGVSIALGGAYYVANSEDTDYIDTSHSLLLSQDEIRSQDIVLQIMRVYQKKYFTKNEIIALYHNYKKSNITQVSKIYLKNLLLNSFLDISSKGFSVENSKELFEVIKIIEDLSDNQIKITTKTKDPDFNSMKTFTGDLQGDKLVFQHISNPFHPNSNINKGNITVDFGDFFNIYIQDTPKSVAEANDLFAKKSKQLEDVEQINRSQRLEILNLNSSIKKLQNNLAEAKLAHELEIKNLHLEHINNQASLNQRYSQDIEKLTFKHNGEITKLNNLLSDKEKEKQSIERQHEQKLKRLLASHIIEQKKLEDDSNKKIANQLNFFNKNTKKYEEEISELKGEITSLKSTFHEKEKISYNNTQKDKATINEYIKDINKLNDKIISLEEEVEDLKRYKKGVEIEHQKTQEEIQKHIEEKNNLIHTYDRSQEAQKALLEQTQNNLYKTTREKSELQRELVESRNIISELIDKNSQFEKENNDLKLIIHNQRDYEKKGMTIISLKKDIGELEEKNKVFETQIKDLRDRNQGLSEKLEKQKDYSKLPSIIKKREESITLLEREKKSLQTELEILNRQNQRQNSENINLQKNIETLLSQISELEKRFKELSRGQIEISQDQTNRELQKILLENKKLTKENKNFSQENNVLLQKTKDQERKINQLQAEHAKELAIKDEQHQAELTKVLKDYFNKK